MVAEGFDAFDDDKSGELEFSELDKLLRRAARGGIPAPAPAKPAKGKATLAAAGAAAKLMKKGREQGPATVNRKAAA